MRRLPKRREMLRSMGVRVGQKPLFGASVHQARKTQQTQYQFAT